MEVDLRHRVLIQSRNAALDTFGQESTTWVDVMTVWAQIEPVTARETALGQAMNTEITHTVTIRYRTGIAARMRLVYAGRTFEITAPPIDVDERHFWLTLQCSEGLTPG